MKNFNRFFNTMCITIGALSVFTISCKLTRVDELENALLVNDSTVTLNVVAGETTLTLPLLKLKHYKCDGLILFPSKTIHA